MPTSALSPTYRRRTPERSDLHRAVRTWFASVPGLLSEYLGENVQLPRFVFKAVQKYLDCGQLATRRMMTLWTTTGRRTWLTRTPPRSQDNDATERSSAWTEGGIGRGCTAMREP
jgi:crotonobetainyl-CoA:carnitine CoA-transferase CaiB-like acyl-CoA transferase